MARRLLVTYLGLTLLILASLEIPLALSYHERLTIDLSADLVRDGFAIAGFAEETVEGTATGTAATDLDALARRYADRSGARVIIVDANAKVLADSDPAIGSNDFSTRPEIATALGGEVATGTRRSDTLGTDLLYAAVPIASNGQVHGAVRITYSNDELSARFRSYVMTLLGVAAVCLTAAGLLGLLFAGWVARPLRLLDDAASSIGAGELDVRASVGAGPPEVRELAATFNAMATEIDELVRAQEAFVADASHQLRSPLAALRLRIENLQSDLEDDAALAAERAETGGVGDAVQGADAVDPEARHRELTALAASDLAAALTEITRLSRLIDGLLALARADRAATTRGPHAPAALGVGAVFEDRLVAWQAYAADRGVALDAEPTDLVVLATEDRLTQALDNLVANAIEAVGGRADARIRFRAEVTAVPHALDRTAAASVDLHVTDNGPGMTLDQLAHAFDRFWRVPATRAGGTSAAASTSGGSGLGLAIARKLVAADHGELVLRNVDTGGLDAVIRLPAGPQPG